MKTLLLGIGFQGWKSEFVKKLRHKRIFFVASGVYLVFDSVSVVDRLYYRG